MKFEKTKAILNQLVADLSQFAAVTHQSHWYMRGRGFVTWHPKFDEYIDTANDQLDTIAERLITLGGSPYSTLEEFAENSKIKSHEASYDVTIKEHLERLLENYRYLISVFNEGIEAAGEEGENVTEDFLIGYKEEAEKTVWMLAAELDQAPGL